MKTWTIVFAVSLVSASVSLGSSGACAQEEESKPKPAARAYPSLDANPDANNNPDNPSGLLPDNNPLTGVQSPTLGSPEMRHSYWVPGFQYANTVQSSGGWSDMNYLAGNLSLLESWSRSQLSLNYSGGGYFSTNASQGNGFFHQLAFVQAFQWQRWQLKFLDQFAYLPESQFGFGGGTSLGFPGIGGSLGTPIPGLGNEFVPSQSIFIATGSRYSNAFVTEASYAISRRDSITMSGSYGILRFVRPGNIESDDVIANVGFNHEFRRADTIGILYRFAGYHFRGSSQAIGDHVVNIAYGRKITGRLALALFVGPDLTEFRVPVNNSNRRVSVSGGGTLTYGFAKGDVSAGYNHGVSGGSGVFLGATTDEVNLRADRQLSRLWRGYMNFGFARNRAITGVILAGVPLVNNLNFHSWVAGVGVDRPIGRNANFSMGYYARIQSANSGVCPPGLCNLTYTAHQITASFQWHTQPFVLR